MKNNSVFGVLVCFCFLFVGAGCSSATEESVPEQQDVQVEVSAVGEVVIMEENEEVDKAEIENKKVETDALAYDMLVEDESALEEEDEDELKAAVVVITGDNFSFSQKEIRVKKGDTVQIEFTSVDGFHDWVVDEFDVRTKQVKSGNTDTITFVANRAGSFEYYCSVGSHRQLGMVGKLIVE